jgi:hypothetical protein
MQKTDKKQFYFPDLTPQFQIDNMIPMMAKPEYEKIVLIQVIRKTAEWVNAHLDQFVQMLHDYADYEQPTTWRHTRVNVSEGGLSLFLNRRILSHHSLYVGLSGLTSQDPPLTFYGNLVLTKSTVKDHKERHAINFYLSESSMQTRLKKLIQDYELGLALKLKED